MIRLETGCCVEDQIGGRWREEALGCKLAQDLLKGMSAHHEPDQGVKQLGGVVGVGKKRGTAPRPQCQAQGGAQVEVLKCLYLFLTLNFP